MIRLLVYTVDYIEGLFTLARNLSFVTLGMEKGAPLASLAHDLHEVRDD